MVYDFIFWLFWTAFAIIFYTYIGYGILIFLFAKLFGKNKPAQIPNDEALPHVTLIYIATKINNTLALDYPKEKLAIWVVADGSTDQTVSICKEFKEVEVFYEEARRGKIHAVNRVIKLVKSPIVIFSDANTFVNKEGLKNMVRHFQFANVGGVAGEKRILSKEEDQASGAGEGLYWKYESALKTLDSQLTTAIGAAGELFAVRTELFQPPTADTIIEDFVVSMKIVAAGYRFVYEPNAYAIETASASIEEEWKRKVRISAGGIQAIFRLPELLNVFKYGFVTWQYVSHRAMRWSIAPLSLAILLVANIFLIAASPFYLLVFIGQVCFYSLATAGHVLREKKLKNKFIFVPYYFTMMNLSVFAGAKRLMRRQQSAVWDKAKRAEG
ncbi:MAG: glycosyltransferase family 2 protein [Cyclobacteriaceae bacterium]|nr:glycosyltransferase family 2 protein [Cyclobacteriaceae bacterium]